jgi:cell division protein FtsZ
VEEPAAPEPAAEAAPEPVQAAPAQPAPVFSDFAEDEPVGKAAPAGADDELVLGADAAVEPEAEPEAVPDAPAGRRRWISPGSAFNDAAPEPEQAAEQAPPAKPKLGGTLFERMSNAARGVAREESTERESLDIPRFLHRQNNQ